MSGYLDLPDRFHEKVEPIEHTGCWEWTANRNRHGYGKYQLDGRSMFAHRVAYEAAYGDIPEGLETDHLCSNRCCVNPSHLEAVTRAENVRRSGAADAAARRQRAKTHCKLGHPYSGSNLYVRASGARQCRACKNIAVKKCKRKKA